MYEVARPNATSRSCAQRFLSCVHILRLGEEVWEHKGRSLKDVVIEMYTRITQLEAPLGSRSPRGNRKPGNTPLDPGTPGNTPLDPGPGQGPGLGEEGAWPSWASVEVEGGRGCGGVDVPFKAPPPEAVHPEVKARPKKAPPKLPPQGLHTPDKGSSLVAPREGSPGMEPGHGGADRDPNIMSNLSLLPSMPDGRPDPWDCPPPPPAGGGARAPPATPAKKAPPAVWLPGPSPAMKAPPQEESMPPHIGRKAPPPCLWVSEGPQ